MFLKTKSLLASITIICFAFLFSCGSKSKNESDTIPLIEQTPATKSPYDLNDNKKEILLSVDSKLLIQYFSGEIHPGSNLPCLYFEPTSKKFCISARELNFTCNAKNTTQALKDFEKALYQNHYEIRGKVPPKREMGIKTKMNGKDAYIVTMDEIMGNMNATNKAKFSNEQYEAMRQTRTGDAYGVLAEKDFSFLYASLGKLNIRTKNADREFTLAQVDSAFAFFSKCLEKNE
ncbi:MAG: hypothetical protein IAF38_12535 [Bacteroidia bacterium]|nr:hypothetical protein [Bacteroidia bacterium]